MKNYLDSIDRAALRSRAEQMLHTERAEADRTVANIDVATKVVIPQHLAMAVA